MVLLFGISGGEIILILLFVLLIFGPKKIPEIARLIGKGINEAKKVQREFKNEINRCDETENNTISDIQSDIDNYKEQAIDEITENRKFEDLKKDEENNANE